MTHYVECLSRFHLNISSLHFHFDEFSKLFIENKLHFGILGISESRLKSDKILITSTYLPEYNREHTPAEDSKNVTLLYIKTV